MEWIAVKNANLASVVCFYEPDIPEVLKNMVQKKTETESFEKNNKVVFSEFIRNKK